MRRILLVTVPALLTACSLLTDLHGLSGGLVCDGGACGVAAPDGSSSVDVATDASAMDAVAEAGADGGPSVITVVQSGSVTHMGATAAVTLNPSRAGDTIIVAVTQETGAATTVLGVADDAPGGSNVYVSAGQRSVDSMCDDSVEIWYASNVKGGAKTVTLTTSAVANVEVWAIEVAGLAATMPLESGAASNDQPASAQQAAPRVTTTRPAFVVSTVATCAQVNSLVAGTAFTALPVLDGEDTAYLVAPIAGSYGAAWTASSATWCASTVAFH